MPSASQKRAHVVGPHVEVPIRAVAPVAAAVAAMIEVHDLRDIRELPVGRLEQRVIEAGAAVQEQQGRPLAHLGAVGDEP